MARRTRPKRKSGLKTSLQDGRSLRCGASAPGVQSTKVSLYPEAGEDSRAQAVSSLALLDTAPEERFDRICRLTRDLMGVPATYVSLIDRDRQWFKSTCGMGDVKETPREGTFCDYAIQKSTPTVVLDATQDPFFAKSPYVADGPKVRFYIGFPLMAAGQRVGTLCALGFEPRAEVTDLQMEQLYDLARMAERELTLLEHDAQNSHAEPEAITVSVLSAQLWEPQLLYEQLKPDISVALLELALAYMVEVAQRWQGDLVNTAGGGIRVVFGSEGDLAESAARAAACSLEMQRSASELNKDLAERGLPQLSFGIGLHTGATTDTMIELTQRVGELACEGQILATEDMMLVLGGLASARGQLRLKVAGFGRAVQLYDLVGLGDLMVRESLES